MLQKVRPTEWLVGGEFKSKSKIKIKIFTTEVTGKHRGKHRPLDACFP